MRADTKSYQGQDPKADPTRALEAADIQPLGSKDRQRLQEVPASGIKAIGGKIMVPPKSEPPALQYSQKRYAVHLQNKSFTVRLKTMQNRIADFALHLLHTKTSKKILNACGIETIPNPKFFWLMGSLVMFGFCLGGVFFALL